MNTAEVKNTLAISTLQIVSISVWTRECVGVGKGQLIFVCGRFIATWASRRPEDAHFLEKIVLFFICCLINCSFEQAL